MRIVAGLLALLSMASVARAEIAPENLKTVELVPAVHRGHSTMWKTGAIITVTSIGVTLLGAALVVTSLHGDITESSGSIDGDKWIVGLVFSAVGDGGLAIGGPITWLAGIGRRAE